MNLKEKFNSNVKESISILEKIQPKSLTKESTYQDAKGKCCLVGEIVRKRTGLEWVLGMCNDSMKDWFGTNQGNEIDDQLTNLHWKWATKKITFPEMKKDAVAYLRGLIEE